MEKFFIIFTLLSWSLMCLCHLVLINEIFSFYLTSPGSYPILSLGNLLVFFPIIVFCSFLFLTVILHNRYYLNYKVSLAQCLGGLIVILSVISLMNSTNTENLILRTILLVILGFLAYLLVKSILAETFKKKAIQKTSQKILKINKELKRLDKAKTDFIVSASHQLRGPLSVIKGISSMFLDGSFGKIRGPIKDSVTKIFMSNERLISLIEDLLDVSHLEEGKVDFNFVKLDVNKIAKKAFAGLTLQAKSKKLYLKFKPSKKDKLLVWADEQKIIEVVSNLIDNALKYTRRGGVTVEVKKSGKFARINVRDTGIGLKKDEIKNLFQRFVRAGRGKKVNTAGTGLGLYMVRKMVEAHKGKVWAESAGENHGSTFCLEFPLDMASPPDSRFVRKIVMKKQAV